MTATIGLLAFVTIERLGELWLANRNTKALLDNGAYEVAARHYILIVILHAAWIVGLWYLAWNTPITSMLWLAVFFALQLLRFWVLTTLGTRWTTRIIVVPGSPLIDSGPYRLFSHPNYMIVIGEIAALPLCFGLGWYALIFSILNACVLFVRIREENAALSILR